MEKPTPAALSAFDAAFPQDTRALRKKMFGMPAGFVNGNMFLGVFADGVVFRLPEARVQAVSGQPGVANFEPMPGRPWKEYVHASATTYGGGSLLADLAQEALDHTAGLPAKEPASKKKKA